MKKTFLFLLSISIPFLANAATITITIDDTVYQRALDGFATQNAYRSTVPDSFTGNPIPNPETKDKFMNRLIVKYITDSISAAEAVTASETARENALQDAGTAFSGISAVSSTKISVALPLNP